MPTYHRLLALLPPGFRRRFSADMERDLERLLAAAATPRERRRLHRLAVLDLLATLGREWRAALVSPRPRRHRTPTSRGTDVIAHELRLAFRAHLRRPGWAALAVATLALGVGATTAIFGVADAVVLQPLPFPDPERLVRLLETTPQGEDFSTSQPNFVDFRARSRTVDPMAAFSSSWRTWSGDGEPQRLLATVTSRELFPLLGGGAALGRLFSEEEDAAGDAAAVAVLSHRAWTSRFGGDAGVLGRTLLLDGAPYAIVGVASEGFEFPGETDLWVPLGADPVERRGDHRLAWIGRLAPGVDPSTAEAELAGIAAALAAEYPASNTGWGARLDTFPDWILGPELRRALALLGGGAGLLLVIACANLAGLLAVRAAGRRREMAVRSALGAGSGGLVRQVVLESLLLGIAAAAAGAGVARLAMPVLRRLAPEGIPRLEEAAVDLRALGVAVAAALATSLVTGILQGLAASRGDVAAGLAEGRSAGGRSSRRLRDAMIAGELTVATVLLVAAGLLLASYQRLLDVDPGFRAAGLATVDLVLEGERYARCDPATDPGCVAGVPSPRSRFLAEAAERLGALPGVEAVGVTNIVPLSGGGTGMEITIEGREVASTADTAFADWRSVTAGFFPTVGLAHVRGRPFTAQEELGGAPVVLVSEELARRYWPGEDAVGKRLAFGAAGTNWQTVVGVVDDLRDQSLAEPPRPIAFVPYAAVDWPYVSLVVRAAEPRALAAAVRRELRPLDPGLPAPDVRVLEDVVEASVARPRFHLFVMGLFAGLAALLAALGVYGVVAHLVARRQREIGVRIALGAAPAGVARLVLGQGLRPAALGIAVGCALALALGRLVESLLFATRASDPRAFAAVVAGLVAVTTLACLLPARRASRVDPRAALGAE